MSHYSDFSLTVLPASDISQHFSAAIADILLAGQIVTEITTIAKKSIRGSTRSDWFKWKIAEVLAQTPYVELQFLSENVCSHLILTDKNFEIIEESELINLDEDARNYFTLHYYTVIPANRVTDILAEVNDLLIWCGHHVGIVADILEWGEDDIQNALDTMQVYEHVNDCDYGEDGDSFDFFFSALKSIQTTLSYAQEHGLYAIYENENYDTGLDWLLNNKPRLISFV